LGGELASIYPQCGALLNIPDILLECELHNEGHHTRGTHVTLHDVSRDDFPIFWHLLQA